MTKIYVFHFIPKVKIKFLALTFLFPPKGKDEIVWITESISKPISKNVRPATGCDSEPIRMLFAEPGKILVPQQEADGNTWHRTLYVCGTQFRRTH